MAGSRWIDKNVLVTGGNHIVFHSATGQRGRGYIQIHPADIYSNLSMDYHIFEADAKSNLANLVFSSTAYVYPVQLMSKVDSHNKSKEADSDPTKADNHTGI